MNIKNLLRVLIIIIIIIGGVIIIIIGHVPKPDPPPCLVCGVNMIQLGGWVEVVAGIAAFVGLGRLSENTKVR